MAQRVQVLLVCDLHDDETVGEETLSFSLDGGNYEIDVCADHADEIRDGMAGWIGAGRRLGGRTGRRARAKAAPAAAKGRYTSADVRAWAHDNGIKVSGRGRIPAALRARFEAAH